MSTTTTRSYEKTALLPVEPDAAFALLTEPERLRRWQAVSARIDLRSGGDYRWTIVPGHVAAGTVREVEPGRRLVLGWGWEGSDDLAPDASTVTITFEPADGGTLVRLVHDGLSEQQAAGHAEGWEHFVGRLQQAAATGAAGPDEWAWAPAELTPLTSADATLAVLQHVLRDLEDSALTAPTPCSEYDGAALVEHLLGSVQSLGGLAGASVRVPSDGPAESRVADAAQQAVEAWQARGLDGNVLAGPREMPAGRAASILSLEFLVHAWDLATATGRTVAVSEEVSDYVLTLARDLIAPPTRQGRFAPEVETGPEAGALARLVAFTGRRPA